jgi:superfamily II DNA helicase RecQ
VHIGSAKEIEPLVTKDELVLEARRLSEQLRTLRKQDASRMDAIDKYAIAERCRAQLLGEYFELPVEEECGICDVCRRAPQRPAAFFDSIRKRPTKGKRSTRGKSRGKPSKKAARRPRRRRSGRPAGGSSSSPEGRTSPND